MKKILLTLLFIASAVLSHGRYNNGPYGLGNKDQIITIYFKNGDVFSYQIKNHYKDSGYLELSKGPEVRANPQGLPSPGPGEWLLHDDSVWEKTANATYQVLLDIQHEFCSRNYRAEIWKIYRVETLSWDIWIQGVYFDAKDVYDVKITYVT